ncbi:MAG: NRDE family protein [Burkholderiaceae bacterium]|nr:NRDE family protein [Burkholderiaceae bacterium]MCD8518032.1 NRDE family protein [Burkholderiaceae bacterium]MCD8537323.1 NRDE family protein [Burkholderiaceae bacterium]MCD8564355.1 NRDE family protein [Burkholderiaceae bacterium]
MCLAVFALNTHPDWPVIIAANRDEYHARATLPMQPWPEAPTLLAGRDLQAGGTWLGISSSGRIALLTNVRNPAEFNRQAWTRGELVPGFLCSEDNAQHYLSKLQSRSDQYNGFNLVLIDDNLNAWHASNCQDPFSMPIEPGLHGISNALLDTQWPKTQRTKEALGDYLRKAARPDPDRLVEIMLDTTPVDDSLLPETGVGLPKERLLSTPFIVSPDYGTRCTTLVLRNRRGMCWVQEDSYNRLGEQTQRLRWQLGQGRSWQLTHLPAGSLITD